MSVRFKAPWLALCCCGLAGAGAQGQEQVVVWDRAARIEAGTGYRDNVLRTSIAPEGSAYWRTSADASLMRLNSADMLFVLFLLGEDIRYLEGPVGYEQFLSGTAQFTSPVGERDEASAELTYLYQHQVFDASETEADLYRILVKGHGLTGKLHDRHTLADGWYATLEGTGLRQLYEEELDDYWEAAARLGLAHSYGNRSEASAGVQLLQRDYDTRNQFDASGILLPGTSLFYRQQEIGGEWKHYFDAERRWRSSTRGAYMLSRDNGSGYFDYNRLIVRQELRWNDGTWDLKGAARFGCYRYAVQRVNGNRRERSYTTLSLSGERRLGEHWLVHASAEHEWNVSNDPLDEYRTWYVEAGLGYDF